MRTGVVLNPGLHTSLSDVHSPQNAITQDHPTSGAVVAATPEELLANHERQD